MNLRQLGIESLFVAKELLIHGLVSDFTLLGSCGLKEFFLESLDLIGVEIVKQVLPIDGLSAFMLIHGSIVWVYDGLETVWLAIVVVRLGDEGPFHLANLVRNLSLILRVIVLHGSLVAIREDFVHAVLFLAALVVLETERFLSVR